MVVKARYKPNHAGMRRFLNSKQAQDPVVAVAEAIAEVAKANSVRSNRPGPHMADQFKVERVKLPVSGELRGAARVTNSDPAAVPNEFGGKKNKAHRMLGRAGAQFGDAKGGAAE
jgi:hypothetical protein